MANMSGSGMDASAVAATHPHAVSLFASLLMRAHRSTPFPIAFGVMRMPSPACLPACLLLSSPLAVPPGTRLID